MIYRVTTDYSFFENSLNEVREYRFTNGWQCDRFLMKSRSHIGNLDVRPHLQIVPEIAPDKETYLGDPFVNACTVKGSHVMRPGMADCAMLVQEKLQLALPPELETFLQRWNGGFLLFREFYELLSAEEIVEVAIEMDETLDQPFLWPHRVIRFCDLGNSNYLVF